jgi:transposase InsO family protein
MSSAAMWSAGWSPPVSRHAGRAAAADTIAAQQVPAGQLTIHADRGTSMTSKPVAMLLADLGVTKSHSRPHLPDDNPYSESQFKTSSTTLPSPTGSAASRTPARSARASSTGTTPSTTTAGSRCSPRRRPLRPRRADHHCPRGSPGGRLRHPSRAVRPQATHPAPAARGGVDQQAHRPNGVASAISWLMCLTKVDRLRPGDSRLRLVRTTSKQQTE